MKKKLLAIVLTLVAALSLTAFATTTFALDDSKPAAEIQDINYIEKTHEVSVQEAPQVTGVAFSNVYRLYILKDGTPALPQDWTAHAVFEDGTTGPDFALTADNCVIGTVDTSATGWQNGIKVTVEYEGEDYELEIEVEVYEIYDLEIKEFAVVEWFTFMPFIQFPNSTTNTANMNNIVTLANLRDKLSYNRADGTAVMIDNVVVLSGGNVVLVLPFRDYDAAGEDEGALTINNWNKGDNYQVGDILTIYEGFTAYKWTGEKMGAENPSNPDLAKLGTGMVIPEAILKTTVQYKFDGELWGLYVEYTDIAVADEAVEVGVNATVSAGATRVPENATTGTITYTSSDPQTVTVSERGLIQGVKEGTATITVKIEGGTAGEITKTIAVTVVDAITKLQMKAGKDTLNVKKGTAELDITKLAAEFVLASGKTEAADLTNATIIGYDKDTVGEQTVTLKVVKDGKTFTTTFTVNVKKAGGCGANFIALSGALTAVLAAVVVFIKRK